MKILDLVFYFFLCVVLISAQSVLLNAQEINNVEGNLKIQIDFQDARAIVDLMKKSRVSDDELNRAAKLSGNRQLIKKVFDNNSVEATEIFKKTLRQTIENQKISDDPFEWQSVKKNLPQMTALINQIENDKTDFLADIEKMIQPYAPKDLKGSLTATFLSGGGSLGFTLDNEPNLYVALQKIGDDYEGLKYLVAHELYHSVQELGRQKRLVNQKEIALPDSVRNDFVIIKNTYTEGTATLVGDPQNAKNLKKLGQSQKDEYAKNLARSRLNFALFEALLFQTDNNKTADIDQIYRIGFTTAFDETLYFVGYRMARAIEKYKGKQTVAALIEKNPIEFFNLYVELYKAHNDDPTLIKFNKSTEDTLSKLQEWNRKT